MRMFSNDQNCLKKLLANKDASWYPGSHLYIDQGTCSSTLRASALLERLFPSLVRQRKHKKTNHTGLSQSVDLRPPVKAYNRDFSSGGSLCCRSATAFCDTSNGVVRTPLPLAKPEERSNLAICTASVNVGA